MGNGHPRVRHVVRGRVVDGADVEYVSGDRGCVFTTPAIELGELVWRRVEQPPAAELPLDEVIDFMVGGGKKNPNLDEKLKPAKLSKKDKAALKAFLQSLTGTATFTRAPELPK